MTNEVSPTYEEQTEIYRAAGYAAAQQAYDAGHVQLAVQVAPAWMGEPGTMLEGTVIGIVTRDHPEWGTYPIVGVKVKDSGQIEAVHCLPQTLRDGMRACRPQAGDPIVITSLGDRTSKARESDYHLYAVSIPGAATAPYEW